MSFFKRKENNSGEMHIFDVFKEILGMFLHVPTKPIA